MPGRRPPFIVHLALTHLDRPSDPSPPCLGRLGHRVISRLAEKHMTPVAKAGVAAC